MYAVCSNVLYKITCVHRRTYLSEKFLVTSIWRSTFAQKSEYAPQLRGLFFFFLSYSSFFNLPTNDRIVYINTYASFMWLFIYLAWCCCSFALFSVPQNNKVLRLCFFLNRSLAKCAFIICCFCFYTSIFFSTFILGSW